MSTSLSAKERILARAHADYQPALVAIDAAAVEHMPARAERFQHLAVGLAGTPAGQTDAGAAAYSIVLNSLNFMFWNLTPSGMERYHLGELGGSDALKAGLDRLWGADPTPATLRLHCGACDEAVILTAFGDIPLARRRAQFLREVLSGTRLEQAAAELVAAAARGGLTADDGARLGEHFPMAYGQDPYLVRAQLALLWYAGHLGESGRGIECDITVAASYQMPRVLRAIGVLRFAPALAAQIDKCNPIMRDSPEERAIRAATVLGAQLLARHIGVSEHVMVNVLWHNRLACGDTPYHLTVTSDY